MGNQPTKKGSAQQPINEYATKYNLSREQISSLSKAFLEEGVKELDQKRFANIVTKLRDKNPELINFDDEIIGMIFLFCDSDHSGKVDPYEIVAVLATFTSGDANKKAEFVFKTIDKDGSGALTRDEVRRHAEKVLSISANLVKKDLKADSAEIGAVGSLAVRTVGAALSSMKKHFADDITKEVFINDTDKDGLIQLNEWLVAAENNNTVKALVDPNLSANAWRTLFGKDANSEEIQKEIEKNPKRFAILFDYQAREGKVSTLQEPPKEYSITFKKGSDTHTMVLPTKTTFSQLLDIVTKQFPDIPTEGIVLKNLTDFSSIRPYDTSETLLKLDLKDGDQIGVFNCLKWSGNLSVKTLTGRIIIVPANADTTVDKLKLEIQDSQGIPPDQQRLVYVGRQLDGKEKTLKEYYIVDDDTLFLILRLRS